MSLFAAFRTPKDEKLYYPSDESAENYSLQPSNKKASKNTPEPKKRLSGIFDKLRIGSLQLQTNVAVEDKKQDSNKELKSINLEALQRLITKDFPVFFSHQNMENFASLKQDSSPLTKLLDTSLQKTLEALNGLPSDSIKRLFQAKLASLLPSISTQELNISRYFLKFYLKNPQETKQSVIKSKSLQESKLNLKKDIYRIISTELYQRALQDPQCSSFAKNEFQIEDLTLFPEFREHLLEFIGIQTRAPQERIFIDHVFMFKKMFNDPSIVYNQTVEQERKEAAEKILKIISEINTNDYEIDIIIKLFTNSTIITHTLFDKIFEAVVVSIFQNYVCASSQESFWKSSEGNLFCIKQNIPIFAPKSIDIVSKIGQGVLSLQGNA